MYHRLNSAQSRLSIVLAALLCGASESDAEQPSVSGSAAAIPSVRTSNRPVSPEVPDVAMSHPLRSVIEYARQEQAYLRQTVRDFTCRLVKRERIDGFLQDYQYIDMCVREESQSGGKVVSPLSIYLQFLAPKKVAGRRVLFVDGRNDGKMQVRNGGKHFDYVVVDVDPYGQSAMDECLVPVTQSGFNQILARMIEVLERHAAADPTGANTEVRRIAGARLDNRPCSVIRITHARKQAGLEFHMANVFVDQELHVPARVDYSDWATRPNQPPPLIAEYTYTLLKMNVGLSDSTFSSRQMRGNPAK